MQDLMNDTDLYLEHLAGYHKGNTIVFQNRCSECFKERQTRVKLKVGSMDWRESRNHDRAVLREWEQD